MIGYVQLLTSKRVMNYTTLINQSLRGDEGKDSDASVWNVLYDFINETQEEKLSNSFLKMTCNTKSKTIFVNILWPVILAVIMVWMWNALP